MKIALSRRQDERNKNVSLSQEQRILHDRNLQAHLLVLWAGIMPIKKTPGQVFKVRIRQRFYIPQAIKLNKAW